MNSRLVLITFKTFTLWLLVTTSHASAALIEFDLRAPVLESLDGAASLTLLRDGVTATLTASVGALNRTASAFGIATPGCGNSDELDASCTTSEAIGVTFDRAVRVVAISVSRLSRGDRGRFTEGAGNTWFEFDRNGRFETPDAILEPGLAFSVASVADGTSVTGRGFSFDRFIVEPAIAPQPPRAVPEPAIPLLLGAGALAVTLIRRRRHPG